MWWGKSNWRYSPDINVWEGKESHMNRTGDIFIGAGGAQFGFQKSSHLQPLASGCKWLQVAASGCKWLQVAGCGWLWLVVAGCGWLWLVVAGCGWLWLVVAGCGWLWLVVAGCGWCGWCGWLWLRGKWLQVASRGCLWLEVAAWASDSKWLQVAASGCEWLRGCLSKQLFSIEVSKLEKAMVLNLSLFFQDLNARAEEWWHIARQFVIRSDFCRPKTDVMAAPQKIET